MLIFLLLQIEWQATNKIHNEMFHELIVSFTIPRHELKRIAEDSFFYVRYETQLKVYDKAGNQITGDYWPAKRVSDTLAISDSVKLLIPVNSSYFFMKILDLNGGEIFNVASKILPLNYVGNIKYALANDTLRVNFLMLNRAGNVDSMLLAVDGIKQGGPVKLGIYDDSLSFFVAGLTSDNYLMKFEIFSKSKKIDEFEIPIKIARSFFLDEQMWSAKVNQLEYIAIPSEIKKLMTADKSERDSLWYAFWKQYDPTPNTTYNEKEVEYFERIAYCEKYFSHGDRGWRSDRAKVYVKYGPPDEIQSRPYEIHARPYETWFYYRLNRKYIFMDEHGFGEYILVNPQGSLI